MKYLRFRWNRCLEKPQDEGCRHGESFDPSMDKICCQFQFILICRNNHPMFNKILAKNMRILFEKTNQTIFHNPRVSAINQNFLRTLCACLGLFSYLAGGMGCLTSVLLPFCCRRWLSWETWSPGAFWAEFGPFTWPKGDQGGREFCSWHSSISSSWNKTYLNIRRKVEKCLSKFGAKVKVLEEELSVFLPKLFHGSMWRRIFSVIIFGPEFGDISLFIARKSYRWIV